MGENAVQIGPQSQVEAQLVVKYLQQRLAEVELQNAVLRAQVESMSSQFVDVSAKDK